MLTCIVTLAREWVAGHRYTQEAVRRADDAIAVRVDGHEQLAMLGTDRFPNASHLLHKQRLGVIQ